MPLTVLPLCLFAAAASAGSSAPVPDAKPVHVIDEKERVQNDQTEVVRLSLPTQSDVDAWSTPGLRVQLGYSYASAYGRAAALSFKTQSISIHPTVRIDEHWALGLTLLYGTGPHGFRWSVTAQPTFFVWRQLSVSFGLGFGGLSVSDPNASQGSLRGPDQIVSRDLRGDERLSSCTGSAFVSELRAEYLFIAGPLFASGPFAQASSQWTHCQATFGRTDAETGRPVVLSQWWQQQIIALGWWFSWR